jgi:hypothetical protein
MGRTHQTRALGTLHLLVAQSLFYVYFPSFFALFFSSVVFVCNNVSRPFEAAQHLQQIVNHQPRTGKE